MRLKFTLAGLFIPLAALLLAATPTLAAPANTYYLVHLSRVADNAYRDQTSGLIAITSGCLSLVLGEDVIYNDTSRQFSFQDGQTCQVQGFYRPEIQLTRVDQDLYRDSAGRGFLHTQFCYAYAYSEDVIILPGEVLFMNSAQRCQIALK